MKRLFIGLLAGVLVMTSTVVRADQQTSLLLTDEQISEIRTNCVATQAILQRLYVSDRLARVNLGQQYETIATKLMAPLNSRIALNQLNGLDLSQTTVDFNAKQNEFRSLYQQYETALLKSTQMSCVNQPVAFYDSIAVARKERAAVRVATQELNKLVIQYGDQFDQFATRINQPPATSPAS